MPGAWQARRKHRRWAGGACSLALALYGVAGFLWRGLAQGGPAFGSASAEADVETKPYVYHIPDWPEEGVCSERRSSKSAAVQFAKPFGAAVGTCRDAGYTVASGTYAYKVPMTSFEVTFDLFKKK
eukprot:CAMPEP_0204588858 /NCGR_PEP_ID=MMETSP0661-20131031/48860_1 /ASSEMBLY_ACC=CAM_ASM_000606 /TAXON_ID=109239 /ORGANISM="Alexandrium margalefi, Strain AMGDE01CS-322" /LENGTH=125 /DNA_ID=CAMNT_0051598709 /DNA_START=88 /DNA_END=465 /DNA_ORIENTATION=+